MKTFNQYVEIHEDYQGMLESILTELNQKKFTPSDRAGRLLRSVYVMSQRIPLRIADEFIRYLENFAKQSRGRYTLEMDEDEKWFLTEYK